MDIVVEYIVKLWPVLIAIIGVVSWLVKVDGRTIENEKAIARVEKESSESMGKLEVRIDARRKEDMGVLTSMLTDIKQDIRELRDK